MKYKKEKNEIKENIKKIKIKSSKNVLTPFRSNVISLAAILKND